jgi:uncharacterized protein (DUF1697 family)
MRYVALIRGINVGTAKRVPMADLRAALTASGLRDVATLLNSGNVVFTDPETGRDRAAVIMAALADDCGVAAHAVVLTEKQFGSIMTNNTIVDPAHDPSRFLVTLFARKADRERFIPLAARDWAPDALQIGDAAVYAWCEAGALDSPLAKAVARAAGKHATTRNWATMLKLYESLICESQAPVSSRRKKLPLQN